MKRPVYDKSYIPMRKRGPLFTPEEQKVMDEEQRIKDAQRLSAAQRNGFVFIRNRSGATSYSIRQNGIEFGLAFESVHSALNFIDKGCTL